jgi:DNA-binding transcriptional MerR regulator
MKLEADERFPAGASNRALDPGMGSRVDKREAALRQSGHIEPVRGALRSGELARLAGVSTDLLRHYERIGVLPKAERAANGYRAYPAAALSRVRAARRAVALGFTLPELARIFGVRDRGGAPCRSVRVLAEEKLRKVEKTLVELRALRRQLRKTLGEWDERLRRTAGKRADLLYGLESMPLGEKTRKKGFSRKWRLRSRQ